MALSIYDIINKEIDYKREHLKIRKLFLNSLLIEGLGKGYSYPEVFDSYILLWKYRGVKFNLKEILNDIESNTNCGENPIDDCLYLCELILNVRQFLVYLKENKLIGLEYGKIFHRINDKILYQNVIYILKSLGYRGHIEEDYKVILTKDDADSINTALIVDNEDISNLIMQYNDFKIVKNIKEKQKILQSLANYVESQRKELKSKNSRLEKVLFMAFNKLNIRHNNLEGKEKEEYTSNLKKEELLQWYDRTYNLILISIRLLELDKQIKPFEELAKQHFDN